MSSDRFRRVPRFERAADPAGELRRVLINIEIAEGLLRSGRPSEAQRVICDTLRPPCQVRGPTHGER